MVDNRLICPSKINFYTNIICNRDGYMESFDGFELFESNISKLENVNNIKGWVPYGFTLNPIPNLKNYFSDQVAYATPEGYRDSVWLCSHLTSGPSKVSTIYQSIIDDAKVFEMIDYNEDFTFVVRNDDLCIDPDSEPYFLLILDNGVGVKVPDGYEGVGYSFGYESNYIQAENEEGEVIETDPRETALSANLVWLGEEPILDEEGNFIYENVLDDDGNPINVLDNGGNPTFEIEYEVDGEGNFVFDEDGEKIPLFDNEGNFIYILDDNGDKIPIFEKKISVEVVILGYSPDIYLTEANSAKRHVIRTSPTITPDYGLNSTIFSENIDEVFNDNEDENDILENEDYMDSDKYIEEEVLGFGDPPDMSGDPVIEESRVEPAGTMPEGTKYVGIEFKLPRNIPPGLWFSIKKNSIHFTLSNEDENLNIPLFIRNKSVNIEDQYTDVIVRLKFDPPQQMRSHEGFDVTLTNQVPQLSKDKYDVEGNRYGEVKFLNVPVTTENMYLSANKFIEDENVNYGVEEEISGLEGNTLSHSKLFEIKVKPLPDDEDEELNDEVEG